VPMTELLPHAFDAADLNRPAERRGELPARVREWRGRGTVFVHPDTVGGQRVWTAYWERSDGLSGSEPQPEERGILEEGPTWNERQDAVAWGRERTPRVVVVDAEGGLAWAGEGEPPAALAEHS
jgi:cytidine deaminase